MGYFFMTFDRTVEKRDDLCNTSHSSHSKVESEVFQSYKYLVLTVK